MDWKKWREEKGFNSSFSENSSWEKPMKGPLGLGFGEINELTSPRSEERCSTRRIIKSQCKTEEIEPGKFVRRCEKSKQVLRECIGRPVEVIESDTEYTEDDVTDEVVRGPSTRESSSLTEPFTFPGLRNDIEVLERSMFGGLNRFLEAAEDLTSEIFQSFGKPRDSRESRNSPRSVDRLFEQDVPSQDNESAYTDFAGQLRDV